MAFNTVIQQGSVTSTGGTITIECNSAIDWVWVYNLTVLADAAAAADLGAQFYWQRGMASGTAIEYKKLGTVAGDPLTTLVTPDNTGIFVYDRASLAANPSGVGARVAVSAITDVVAPVFSTADTGALVEGSIVRLSGDTDVPNIMGFDFEVDTVVANTSFNMRYNLANSPGVAGAGDGFYRMISLSPQGAFYPANRFVIDISQAAQAEVGCSVTHGFTVGQSVTMVVPPAFGMTEMNGRTGTVVAVDLVNNTFTLDINSSAFTAFVFPAVADVPFTWAQAVPQGEDTAEALEAGTNILADSTRNTLITAIVLPGGVDSPAGQSGDEIAWVIGGSFAVNNV